MQPHVAEPNDETASVPTDGTPHPLVVDVIVLAGGSGRRLGGVDKPTLAATSSHTLLDTALAAAAPLCRDFVVVGPPRRLAPHIKQTREPNPGSGPLAAIVAGLDALQRDRPDAVFVLAADIPQLDVAHLRRLVQALTGHPDRSAAVAVDADDRWQPLLGLYRVVALDHLLARAGDPRDRPVRWLPTTLDTVAVPMPSEATQDIDVPADLARHLSGQLSDQAPSESLGGDD